MLCFNKYLLVCGVWLDTRMRYCFTVITALCRQKAPHFKYHNQPPCQCCFNDLDIQGLYYAILSDAKFAVSKLLHGA